MIKSGGQDFAIKVRKEESSLGNLGGALTFLSYKILLLTPNKIVKSSYGYKPWNCLI
jgi:hypothetical protein